MSKIIFTRSGPTGDIIGSADFIINGTSMFRGCNTINVWDANLNKLTNGTNMFSGCNYLNWFSGNLSSLTNGTNMFSGCKLNLESITNIADTINDLTAEGTTGSITLGIDKSVQNNSKLTASLEVIRNKGWTVTEEYN